jgi:RTX calcium-binding nonapeptide repeat (4 copies)
MRPASRCRALVECALPAVTAVLLAASWLTSAATPAHAVTSCTYSPATQTVAITIDPGERAAVAVETTAAGLDAESSPGAILFDNNQIGYEDGANSTQCGSGTNTNTASISVLGSSGNEIFLIDNQIGGAFASSIVWAVDLGSNTLGGDLFRVFGSDGIDDVMVFTNASFTMNGGGGQAVGYEDLNAVGFGGSDTIDASAVSIAPAGLNGGAGDDWVAPGAYFGVAPSGGDTMTPGSGVDTLSYATRTTATVADNTTSDAGFDSNGDCDVQDPGDDFDEYIGAFEILETGSGDDCLVGVGGVDERFIPGDGNDAVSGNVGDQDLLDWSGSAAAMTIDPAAGSAIGQGSDVFADVVEYLGSSFDDVLFWDGTTVAFSGGSGVDRVNASEQTSDHVIDLDALDPPVDDLENLLGGSGDDTLRGNGNPNRIRGLGGDDGLFGRPANDVLRGGQGFDTANGQAGNDSCTAEVQISC